jgi:hypothetical protein
VGWIETNPKDALEWARENGVNVADAKGSISISEYGGSWRPAMSTAFGKDWGFTLGWLREQPPSLERDGMLARGLYSGTFEQRLAIYAELTPEGRADCVDQVIFSGSKGDDAGAAEAFVQGLSQGPERIAGIEALVRLHLNTNSDSGQLEQLVSRYPPGPERDAATSAAISSLSFTNQQKALELALQVSDPMRRGSAYVDIARNWIYRDRPAALAWISATPVLDPEVKRVILREAEQR